MRAADALPTGHCPACKRYAGHVRVCPYCDVDIPVRRHLCLIRISTLVPAFGGLMLLWLATNGTISIMLPDLPFRFYTVIKPHLHWMLCCGIAYGLLRIPPDPIPPGQPRWRRVQSANRSLAVITAIILLIGLLALLLQYTLPQ